MNPDNPDMSFDSFSNADSVTELMRRLAMPSNAPKVSSSSESFLNAPKVAPVVNPISGQNYLHRSEAFSFNETDLKRASPYDPSEDFMSKSSLKKSFCCCSSKRICVQTAVLLVIFFSILLGLIGYFCWPRLPKFSVSSVSDYKGLQFSSSNANNDPLLSLRNVSIARPFQASIYFQVEILIDSPNYIDIRVNSISAFVQVYNTRGSLIPFINGTGELNDITIYKLRNTTIYFPITINAMITKSDQVRDWDTCLKSTDTFRVKIDTRLSIQPLSFFNVYPTIKNELNSACPNSFEMNQRNIYDMLYDCGYIDDQTKLWSREEIVKLIDCLSLELPIESGQIISFFLPNCLEFVILFFLIAKQKGISNPLNPVYTRSEMEFYLSDAKTDIVIVQASFEHLEILREICSSFNITLYIIALENSKISADLCGKKYARSLLNSRDESIALFLHTSGTTGRPKLVPLTHKSILQTCQNIQNTLNLKSEDVTFLVMPLFHVHGLIGALLSSLYSKGNVIIAGKFSASKFWKDFVKGGATWFSAVPTIHQILLAQSFDGNIGKLRFIRSCSSSLASATLLKLQEKFKVPVIEAYAMTEASHQISSNLQNDIKPGSVGKGRGVEIMIFSVDDNSALGYGDTGQVCIRGSNVISGYFNNPKANQDSFFYDSSTLKTWFKTGDLGTIDSDGYLNLKGRLKEIINRGGEKISPLEIDSKLLEHSNVLEAVSFGVPHDIYGQEVEAAVVLNNSNISQEDLQTFLVDKLSNFKIPKRIHIAKSLPKTSTGKIQRRFVAQAFKKSKPHL